MALRVFVRPTIEDARSCAFQERCNELLGREAVKKAQSIDVYTIDAPLSKSERTRLCELFATPATEECTVNELSFPKNISGVIEIGFLPGVTDNVGRTAQETIEDAFEKTLPREQSVFSSRLYAIAGNVDADELQRIAATLYNPLIERADTAVGEALSKAPWQKPRVPRVSIDFAQSAIEVNLWVSDEELAQIGSRGIKANGERRGPLALSLEALKVIRTYFHREGRNPTDVELESLAQTWSEHCKHAIFSDPLDEITEGIYRRYIKGATREIRRQKGKDDFCVSVFKDNSGAIAFDKDTLITHKVETHNSPSALDPFGGAITGVVGVNRDALGFGLGAKPVANIYGFCVGNPEDARTLYRDADCTQAMLSPARILAGVVAGINEGGNQSGIPTPLGFVQVDDRYRGKPLVFAGTVGLLPRHRGTRRLYEKQARPGDFIVMIGGRVGLDGIHGATFSSAALDSGSPATAVQIGDPITQKKLSDALVKELRDQDLYTSITDNGAGGLSCSVAEMARECGGCDVALDEVPLKYPGLAPWQIWISESQERMTLAVPKTKWKKLKRLLAARGVEATAIGTFTESGRCTVRFKGCVVMDMDMDFLHEGRPSMYQQTKPWKSRSAPAPAQSKDFSHDLVRLMARPSLASRAFIARQYDHEVQGGSVTKPLVGRGQIDADAAVLRPKLDSVRGVVLSHGYAPQFVELDAHASAAIAIDSAIRAAVAAGAPLEHLALLDNFCWCSSHEPERLYQLKEAARACYESAVAYGTPYISGKDSMFNDFRGYDENGEPIKISVPPTLLISAIGVMADHRKAVTPEFKCAGDVVYLLGETKHELAGSEYYSMKSSEAHVWHDGTDVPRVDPEKNLEVYRACANAIQSGLLASAMSVGRGGLAYALAKAALGGKLGVQVRLPIGAMGGAESTLFSESQGRLLVSVAPGQARAFEKLCSDMLCEKIGEVADKQRVELGDMSGGTLVNVTCNKIGNTYRNTFQQFA